MLLTLARDAAKTARNGGLMIGGVLGLLSAGPHVELALAPPVRLWEIHDARLVGDEIRWTVLIAQKRYCKPVVQWSTGGVRIYPSGPPLTLTPGEAAEIGPFSAPIPVTGTGPYLSAVITYNCGAPWGLAPIEQSARIAPPRLP